MALDLFLFFVCFYFLIKNAWGPTWHIVCLRNEHKCGFSWLIPFCANDSFGIDVHSLQWNHGC